jgi:transforming growth factor-beta-induced protein
MNFRLAFSYLVATSAMTFSFAEDEYSAAGHKCQTIPEVVCGNSETEQVCKALKFTGLDDVLSEGKYTLFAPDDSAVKSLRNMLGLSSIKDLGKDLLTEILLYHVVVDRKLTADRLANRCGRKVTMANDLKTETKCVRSKLYQFGPGNDPGNLPRIIDPDFDACDNSVVHVLDEVMLPYDIYTPEPTAAPTPECDSIKDLVCGDRDFDILCAALKLTDLDDVLSDGTYTVFAPTDDAFVDEFGKNPSNFFKTLLDGGLQELLEYHVVVGKEYTFNDLKCDRSITMATGEKSTT